MKKSSKSSVTKKRPSRRASLPPSRLAPTGTGRTLASSQALFNAPKDHPYRKIEKAMHLARAAYDLREHLPSKEKIRSVFKQLTESIGTKKFPDPPPAPESKIGPRDSTLHPSLEPVAGSDLGVAPSAVSEVISRYAHVAGNDRAMRTRFRQPLCHFGTDNVNIVTPVAGLVGARSVTPGSIAPQSAMNVMTINPLRSQFFFQSSNSPNLFDFGMAYTDGLTVSDIALGFSMWRVCGPMTFYYEPQSSTASTVRIDFAYTDDGAHPVLGISNSNPTAPTVTQIDATTTSVGFSPWNSWQMTVNPDTSWKYSYCSPQYGASQSVIINVNSDTRLASAGAISAVVTGAAGALTTNQIYGRLYLEAEFEFKDPAPLAALSPFYSITRIEKVLNKLYGAPKGTSALAEEKDGVLLSTEPPDPPESGERKLVPPSSQPPSTPSAVARSAALVSPTSGIQRR